MSREPIFLVATQRDVWVADPSSGSVRRGEGFGSRRPTCLAAAPVGSAAPPASSAPIRPPAPIAPEAGAPPTASPPPTLPFRAWCGTREHGVLRTDDGGRSWYPSGLGDAHVTALLADAGNADRLWVGTEPSRLLRTDDGGDTWGASEGLTALPSAPEWAFPPQPDTHHVRWIRAHPRRPDHLWLAIEAGALVHTPDGGRSWRDRVDGGPRDTHELVVHPDAPEVLRAAAGDGYFESRDGGGHWTQPSEGLDVGYFRSIAVAADDPEVTLLSGASRPRSTYVAGHADGRVHRREGDGPWERVRSGFPDPASTIAPLLLGGPGRGEFWAADERGVHRSEDGGRHWSQVVDFTEVPVDHLRGFVQLGAP